MRSSEGTAVQQQQRGHVDKTEKNQQLEPVLKGESPPPRCMGSVTGGAPWYRTSRCTRNAKVQRDGKDYCTQHDPEARKARDAKRAAEQDAEWKRQSAQHTVDSAERAAGRALADYQGDDIPNLLAHHRAVVQDARVALKAASLVTLPTP